jgi:2-C-methyl-D-erythritol 4-phosphate cytidylyltransferase
MKSDRPKQFLELLGEPVIVRTIRRFLDYNPAIKMIVSVHRNWKSHLEGIIDKHGLKNAEILITNGGETRFDSVKNGLMLIDKDDAIVGIHDAARPFVSRNTIAICFDSAAARGSGVPCVPVNDSMRKISNNINNSVNRHEYKIIQTPQCFLVSKIKSAFEQPYSPAFTDDATVLESMGEKIVLVEGNEENFKITSPQDMFIAAALVKQGLPA